MNIEFSKIKSPFQPSQEHLSDLAMRIQRKVGIEALELFEKTELKEPLIPRNPIQLSVEFGNSYVSEKPEHTYIESGDSQGSLLSDTPSPRLKVQPALDTEVPYTQTVFNNEPILGVQAQEISIHTEPIANEEVPVSRASESEIIGKSVEEPTRSNSQNSDPIVQEPNEDERAANRFRDMEIERKRAEAAARYAALLDESRADYVAVSAPVPEIKKESLPWATILGLAASVSAIATAWWVWSMIQTPMSIEQIAENSRGSAKNPASIQAELQTNPIALETLPIEYQVVNDLISEDAPKEQGVVLPHFKTMDEQSKVSMVVLENNGLLVMDLEDDLFLESEL